MTKVVIVGEAYLADLSVGGGPIPPSPGSPSHPWVPPGSGGVPSHPIVIPGTPPGQPGSPTHPIYVPIYPDQGLPGSPPGIWGGMNPHPDQGLPGGSPGAPSHPWVPPEIAGIWPGPQPGHPWVPPTGTPIQPPTPIPPPAGHENDLVIAVYKPGQGWTSTAYPIGPAHPIPPTPQPVKK